LCACAAAPEERDGRKWERDGRWRSGRLFYANYR